MRARNLKPSIFKNELLATSDPLYTVIFEGLWCLADREGRLEDRPRKIHFEVNAGRAFEGTETALKWLTENGFLLRYEVNRDRFIQIVNFGKHQYPHVKEPQSTIPAPDKTGVGTVPARLNPSSLNPESPIPLTRARVEFHPSLPMEDWQAWIAYRKENGWATTPSSLLEQLRELEKHSTEEQGQMIRRSINAGWKGIFPLRKSSAGYVAAPTTEELEARERARS